jgi:flagellar biosynthesis/type III secretory pathway protein FliH
MGVRTWGQLVAVTFCIAATVPMVQAQSGRGRGPEAWRQSNREPLFDQGYVDGVRKGEADARGRRPFNTGNQGGPNNDYRRGFVDGYREGYTRTRAQVNRGAPDWRYQQQQQRSAVRGYREPAFATGFDSGYDKGVEDSRDGDRYDPVRHSDYRNADRGYRDTYGTKDAYRNNFRAGFRQGYEEGYRAGARNRR